ncbi:MAG: hypothetical protein AB7E09_01330 [Candidatus Izemoplasmatales bacterium]|uniref:Uncharacterized protein n=1 Tax=Hujiaoplasma nucleasis TaxID=2725268 RepID=A0A7L6N050_9MOLU|nr:hypothetical protein [Hujiaoplasma nucleasis]QLY39630.1 hypothetical protein HF295_01630 [Hujiaoplasma nucleasis]
MIKNKVFALLLSLINLILVLILITYVIDNPLIEIILGVYAIIFASIVSFMIRNRRKGS